MFVAPRDHDREDQRTCVPRQTDQVSCKIDDANAHVYYYDSLYQLISADYNDGNSTDYYYDALGNRTQVINGGPTTYYSNNLNQYTSVGGTPCTYDANGNLADDGADYKYYYDCENRSTDVNDRDTGGRVTSYSYDYQGRRVRKIVYGEPNIVTQYAYDGDHVIAECNESWQILRKFVYGPGIDEPICMIDVDGQTETEYYYHFDGLGSVVALSDTTGNIVERYSYDVFGEPNRTSDVNNPYMFTGRRYDPETGLYYYRARYYAYDIGRFLQTDPIGYVDGLNLYSYCVNNPVGWKDAYGLRIEVIGTKQHKKAFDKAVKYLSKTSLFRNTYDFLAAEDTPLVRVFVGEQYKEPMHYLNHFAGTPAVLWNPKLGSLTQTGGRMSPAIALAHEMEHARINLIGGIEKPDDGLHYNIIEETYIVEWFEGPIARELGEGYRRTYTKLDHFRTSGPTKRCAK